MNTWAILGDFEFELMTNPSAFSENSSTDWVEHSLIHGKPKVELMGEALNKISLEIKLHHQLTDPVLQLKKLQQARQQRQPLSLVMGNGDYKGVWVITSIDTITHKTDANGAVYSLSVTLNLKEFNGKVIPQSPQAGVVDKAALPIDSQTLNEVTTPLSPVQQAIQQASAAAKHIKAGIKLFQETSSSLSSMIKQAKVIVNHVKQAAKQLQEFVKSVKKLINESTLIVEGKKALKYVKQAWELLTDSSAGNFSSRFKGAKELIKLAGKSVKNVQAELQRISAEIVAKIPLKELAALANPAQQAVKYARAALNTLLEGSAPLQELKENLVNIAKQSTQLFSQAKQAAKQLQEFVKFAKQLRNEKQLIIAGQEAIQHVKQAWKLLTDSSAGSLSSRFKAAKECIKLARERLKEIRADLLRISAELVTRLPFKEELKEKLPFVAEITKRIPA